MLFLYTITLFVSAFLLFWVQPMFGKMLLPLLGNTPNIWNTCMIFFQAVLLLGYIYAHATTAFLGVKRQAILHLIILFLILFFLPINIPSNWVPPTDKNPIFWLLTLLFYSIGLPFFVLSTNAPLLQKWFSNTSHTTSKDPYFLYVASNLGSMLALLGYLFLLEPNLKLIDQSHLWTYSYWLLFILISACAIVLLRSKELITKGQTEHLIQNIKSTLADKDNEEIKISQRIWWILLSFVPSSLMLSVTSYISCDIASVPLLWVIPLLIYLLTFVLVFSRKPFFSQEFMIKVLPITVLSTVICVIYGQSEATWLIFLPHLFMLFIGSMVCHGELAKKRPRAKFLTEYYLWISVGGFLGGFFNAIVAPLIFKSIIEYPLAIVLACLLKPGVYKPKKSSFLLEIGLPILLALMIIIFGTFLNSINLKPLFLKNVLVLGLPLIVCYSFANYPIRFGLSVFAIIFGCLFYSENKEKLLYSERDFFGVHKVSYDEKDKIRYLIHGRTIHGAQSTNIKLIHEPLTYYHTKSPIGNLFKSISDDSTKINIAVIGLGTGSLAYYAKPYQRWTFYEIDPVVKKIAQDKKLFTFLSNCKAKFDIVLGDARLSLKMAENHNYDLIVLDAFSSDSIPVHLLTKEAFDLYLKKLSNGGILAFHISNKFLDLRDLVGNLARYSNLAPYVKADRLNKDKKNRDEKNKGKMFSLWVVMTNDKSTLRNLLTYQGWKYLEVKNKNVIWTDDFSNILSVFILQLF